MNQLSRYVETMLSNHYIKESRQVESAMQHLNKSKMSLEHLHKALVFNRDMV